MFPSITISYPSKHVKNSEQYTFLKDERCISFQMNTTLFHKKPIDISYPQCCCFWSLITGSDLL